MKKVLLIGELSEIVRSLNDCLSEPFQVQLCSPELENVKAMVKIIKPQLIVISQIGTEEMNHTIFEWIHAKHPQIPVLGIMTKENWEQCEGYYQSEQFSHLLRPVTKGELLQKCHELLGEGKMQPKKENIPWRRKIMIVDDSALLLRSMKSMLEKDYAICLAKSGEQALKMIPKENPDLILLDYEMEGMDGKSTFEAMRDDEAMKHIPVVFLTSVADKQSIYSVLKSRPDGYILKPPDENRICETIQEILGKTYEEDSLI